GVVNILFEIENQNIAYLLLMSHDAVEILDNMIAVQSLASIQVYFPDPWPMYKHNTRRLGNQTNIDLFAMILKVGGVFHY
ncbi:tRNA (guanosine(46)-N7)-methyltransferase TrmB, partial [Francisella tularensis subsp. holarctica]|nr:tRNA (guanosine(46)-N7)-methyltransferase TrmB [Francisella tularensis subsp. holarctica]